MPSVADQVLEVYGAPSLEQGYGVSVLLRRGGVNSTAFQATWSDQQYEIVGQDNLVTAVQSRDYVFKKADAVISGSTVEPRPGDRVIEGTQTFEIVALGQRKAVESLPGDYRWLVHTKRV